MRPHSSTLLVADSLQLTVLGDTTHCIIVGGLKFRHTVKVARFLVGEKYGVDFLSANNVCIDLKRGMLSCQGKNIPTTIKGFDEWCCRIMVTETITV